jgi:NAD(P)-dependent dehydrogenase (short-subunit alcohol dehydrogenase family)
VARVFIVGCGGRGQALARELLAAGHAVRGASRDPRRELAMSEAGIEPYIGDPDRIATLMEGLYGTTIVCWLMATAPPGDLHTSRLRMLCEKLVDTPVRGFVYEAAGPAAAGVPVVEDARERWNIPVEIVDTAPEDCEAWTRDMAAAVERLLAPRR